ncbi:MAG: MBL fold metallo-hydrolase [Actinobacteria bacterium]|nr:MBL fold metallo-hydrolase [Actinomycetota bacterium]
MCGSHAANGTAIDHHHDPVTGRRVDQSVRHPLSRRAFLGGMGKGVAAMAVVTPMFLAACSSDDDSQSGQVSSSTTSDPTSAPDTTGASPTTTSQARSTTTASTETTASAEPAAAGLEPVTWARANLGFVSAYVLVRGNTAAIVDTGVSGSANAIGETLATLGLNYSDVAHVILTHNHADHAGSIDAVLGEAINATAYAGEADLGPLPSDIVGLVGGEDIFGFEMLPTPGHTAGHMAVIDHQAGLLVAGDAIFSEGGVPIEGPSQFFSDVPQSRDSIRVMAALTYNTLLISHGEPIESGADAAVATLAASF